MDLLHKMLETQGFTVLPPQEGGRVKPITIVKARKASASAGVYSTRDVAPVMAIVLLFGHQTIRCVQVYVSTGKVGTSALSVLVRSYNCCYKYTCIRTEIR